MFGWLIKLCCCLSKAVEHQSPIGNLGVDIKIGSIDSEGFSQFLGDSS